MNICGVLVHTRPDESGQVSGVLAGIDGVEVHAVSDDGRLVVTVEEPGDTDMADRVLAFHRMPGVLSASLVYHFCDTE